MAGISPAWPYFIGNLAETSKRPVFRKSVPEAGNLKIIIFRNFKRSNAEFLKLYWL